MLPGPCVSRSAGAAVPVPSVVPAALWEPSVKLIGSLGIGAFVALSVNRALSPAGSEYCAEVAPLYLSVVGRLPTVTLTLLSSCRGGTPLSSARTVNVDTPTCEEVGVQVKAPVEGLMVAPVGAPMSE